jgi:ornithine cyclodeaminase/alanine dehydrogenase-like protein (mu-crystallin family)
VLILGYDDVVAALPSAECAEVMAEVLAARARGEAFMPLRSIMSPPGANGFMGLMPGWRDSHDESPAAFALKVICLMPGNPARGLDAHQGLVTMFDGDTGVPTAVLDASAVTEIRTAAVSAVATRLLARPDARVMGILGAGVQARSHIVAMGDRFDEIRVYAPTVEHAAKVAAGDPRGVSTVAASGEEAVRGADVVVVATSSREPVLKHEWLSPGMHVNSVGASSKQSRELEVETVAASALFADSRESLRNEASEYMLAVEQGVIPGEDHVRAELGEVLTGMRPGRRDASELTVFRSLGLAVEDLAAAERAIRNARRDGIGTEVKL